MPADKPKTLTTTFADNDTPTETSRTADNNDLPAIAPDGGEVVTPKVQPSNKGGLLALLRGLA